MRAVIFAERPGSLEPVCGVPLLERLLRGLQRAGVAEAIVLTSEPALFRGLLERPSWARAKIRTTVEELAPKPATAEQVRGILLPDRLSLVARGDTLLDGRLLALLLSRTASGALVDSAPPSDQALLYRDTPRSRHGAVVGALVVGRSEVDAGPTSWDVWLGNALDRGTLPAVDVLTLDPHVEGMRRDLRHLWFPAPDNPEARRLAEHVVLDSAQKATLDLPAYAHGPIETAIIRRLARTRVTPNQLTAATNVVAWAVTALFATGHLVAGTVVALAVGVLDGLDGKQARVKVETTEAGEWEHVADYVYELSWWVALAWHFRSTGLVPNAYLLLGLMWLFDIGDRLARRVVKQRAGRDLDTVSAVDVWFRLIGGRRNVYIWMFAVALLLGRPEQGFVAFTVWGIVTGVFHLIRAGMILLGLRSQTS
jgi:phosphatidylglycerophosphate synthase